MGQIGKQTFLAGVTCPTKGWHAFRALDREITPAVEWRFHVGNEIGAIARSSLGAGVLLPRSPVDYARAATVEALAQPANLLVFEATFATDDFVARADAARRNGDAWDLVEVKSGKLPADGDPDAVKPDYIDDLAFTTFVAEASGFPIARCLLVLVRGDYRQGRPIGELLGEIDVTKQVLSRAREFAGVAPNIATASRGQTRPDAKLILACGDCQFYDSQCLGVGVRDPLFALPRLSPKRFEQLKTYGCISALPSDAELTEAQHRVASVIIAGRPLVEPEGLKHLDAVVWPIYYLDFESVGPAIPWFPDTSPYEQMPCQFSIHVCDAPGRECAHHEYLAPLEGDWRGELASQLVERLGDHGSIVMYSSYERRMLKYLAATVPELAPRLEALDRRLYDLEPMFKNGYCHPAFQGRTSIKATLPALVPDLDYKSLEVCNGDDAAGLFALMKAGKYDGPECARHRENLLRYCELDTLAMVRLHKALADVRASTLEGLVR